MAMTIPTVATSHFRQRLVNLGPGPLVAASEVRVYRAKKNGQPGKRLIRIEKPTFSIPVPRTHY